MVMASRLRNLPWAADTPIPPAAASSAGSSGMSVRSMKSSTSFQRSIRLTPYLRPVPALPTCPSCGSDLVQPLRTEKQKGGDLLVELRCPECFVVMQACHTVAEMADLDKRQTAS